MTVSYVLLGALGTSAESPNLTIAPDRSRSGDARDLMDLLTLPSSNDQAAAIPERLGALLYPRLYSKIYDGGWTTTFVLRAAFWTEAEHSVPLCGVLETASTRHESALVLLFR